MNCYVNHSIKILHRRSFAASLPTSPLHEDLAFFMGSDSIHEFCFFTGGSAKLSHGQNDMEYGPRFTCCVATMLSCLKSRWKMRSCIYYELV